MTRKLILALVFVVLVIAALAGIKGYQIKTLIAKGKAFVPPPETVSTVVAKEDKWQSTLRAIASVTAAKGVIITPDIPGTVREIAFESGAKVAKDALLVRLDVSAELAQLSAITAQVHLATINLERASNLLKDKMVSQAEYDTAKATLEQHQANAEAVQATIDKKTIRAPFAGLLGIRQVNLGQYVESGKPIVSLQALDTVYADFSLPQQDLAQLKSGMAVRLQTDAYPGKEFEGTLSAVNPDLDASTRSVGLQATFQNEAQLLRPGMFARVEVLLPEHRNVLVIPTTSILKAPYGDSVYVVEQPAASGTNAQPGLTVRQQFVRVGKTRGDFVAVESGIRPGEKIVSAGVFKLRNGMSIVENNELTPKASLTPRPADS